MKVQAEFWLPRSYFANNKTAQPKFTYSMVAFGSDDKRLLELCQKINLQFSSEVFDSMKKEYALLNYQPSRTVNLQCNLDKKNKYKGEDVILVRFVNLT